MADVCMYNVSHCRSPGDMDSHMLPLINPHMFKDLLALSLLLLGLPLLLMSLLISRHMVRDILVLLLPLVLLPHAHLLGITILQH